MLKKALEHCRGWSCSIEVNYEKEKDDFQLTTVYFPCDPDVSLFALLSACSELNGNIQFRRNHLIKTYMQYAVICILQTFIVIQL